MTARHALLGAVLALPIALLRSPRRPGNGRARWPPRCPARGLDPARPRLRVSRVRRHRVLDACSLASTGPALFPLLAHAPDAKRATAFLAGSLASPSSPSAERVAATSRSWWALVLALVAGLRWSGPATPMDPRSLAALFGSRDGLLFQTPLLWASLGRRGSSSLRREGRAAAHARGCRRCSRSCWRRTRPGVGRPGPLPALLIGLAAALEACRRLVERRPAWALAPLYSRCWPSRTCSSCSSTATRSEARRHGLVPAGERGQCAAADGAVGAPIAWPANWIWSARTNLPVERWDLLSGQRLPAWRLDRRRRPRPGCGVPPRGLERAARVRRLNLPRGRRPRRTGGADGARGHGGPYVYAAGSGALRVSVNGESRGDARRSRRSPDRGWLRPPMSQWPRREPRGPGEPGRGVQLVDGLEIRSILGPAF